MGTAALPVLLPVGAELVRVLERVELELELEPEFE